MPGRGRAASFGRSHGPVERRRLRASLSRPPADCALPGRRRTTRGLMGDELGGFLDREQLLGGSPARRAATLLFLIEARTARLAAQARQRLVRPLTDESVE